MWIYVKLIKIIIIIIIIYIYQVTKYYLKFYLLSNSLILGMYL